MKHRYVHKDSQIWLKVPIQRRDTKAPLTCHGVLICRLLATSCGEEPRSLPEADPSCAENGCRHSTQSVGLHECRGTGG